MHKNEKCAILDEIDENVSLTTIDDYTLIFMNNHLKKLLNIEGEDYVGKKCYEVIHHLSSPCEFCKNFNLNNENYECAKKYIPHFGRYYTIKGKSIHLDDELVRLVVTDDITEVEVKNLEISRRVKAEESILKFMNNLTTEKKLDKAIDSVLEEITKYYKGDRGYIFYIDYINSETNNTHEFNMPGVVPQIQNLQHLPISIISRWVELFNKQNYIFIDSLDDELDKNSDEYKILKEQDIDRLLAIPFYVEGKLIGFIGIDNPKYDYNDITVLKSISFFVFYDMSRRTQIRKLEELSSYDTLTGLKNRNSYIDQIDVLENKTPDNIGIIYIDLNGLKEANDKFGHAFGDERLKNVASVINKFFENDSYRVGGDEFVVIITNIEENRFVKRFNMLLDAINNDSSINVSVGYVYEQNPLSIEALITKADGIMYEEKLKYYELKGKNK